MEPCEYEQAHMPSPARRYLLQGERKRAGLREEESAGSGRRDEGSSPAHSKTLSAQVVCACAGASVIACVYALCLRECSVSCLKLRHACTHTRVRARVCARVCHMLTRPPRSFKAGTGARTGVSTCMRRSRAASSFCFRRQTTRPPSRSARRNDACFGNGAWCLDRRAAHASSSSVRFSYPLLSFHVGPRSVFSALSYPNFAEFEVSGDIANE
jgi:hypothetical protein